MSPYAVQIAYLKSLIIILESMDESEEDVHVSIGVLNEVKTNMGKLIKTLQEIG
tara:strand:- start:4611 stop:4772 length:162 start_codon:yes stop_codon:yes gene_type:complete